MYVEFEPGMKYTKNLTEISEDHTHFKDAGWVLTEDDYVIDIDTLESQYISYFILLFSLKLQKNT